MYKKLMVLAGVVGVMLCIVSVSFAHDVTKVVVYTGPGDAIYMYDSDGFQTEVAWNNPGRPGVLDLPDGTYKFDGVGGARMESSDKHTVGVNPTIIDWNVFGFVDGGLTVLYPSQDVNKYQRGHSTWGWKAWPQFPDSPYVFASRVGVYRGDHTINLTVSGGEITGFSEVNNPNGLWEQLNSHAIAFNYTVPGILVLAPEAHDQHPESEARIFLIGGTVVDWTQIYSEISELWLPDGVYQIANSIDPMSHIYFTVSGGKVAGVSDPWLQTSAGSVPDDRWIKLSDRVLAFGGFLKNHGEFVSMISDYTENYGLDLTEEEIGEVMSTAAKSLLGMPDRSQKPGKGSGK